ncbi:MAG: STAS domain-containing protein [Gammaproteobacteria bacterium]|nr:STAS domain-containing protein [Gammaproteobacteria bacterium]
MELKKELKKDSDKLYITLEGNLDTSTAPSLEADLVKELVGVKEVELDLTKLIYISSAGLRLLLLMMKAVKVPKNLTVINPNKTVKDVLKISGFDNLITIINK